MARQAAFNKKWCFSHNREDRDVTALFVLQDPGIIDTMQAVLDERDAKGLMLKGFHLLGSTTVH